MPYYPKRRYTPKRKPSIKSRFRKPSAPLTMGKFKKEVRKMIYKQKERKVHGTSVTEQPISTLGNGYWNQALLSIPQGDAFNQRDGNIVHLNGLALRGFFHSNQTSAGPIGVRMAVVQHIGKDVTNDKLFTDASGVDQANVGNNSNALHWSFNREAFRTLASKVYILNTDGQRDNTIRQFKMYVKPLIKRLMYDSGSTQAPERNLRFIVYARQLNNDETTGSTVEMTFNHTAYFVDV